MLFHAVRIFHFCKYFNPTVGNVLMEKEIRKVLVIEVENNNAY